MNKRKILALAMALSMVAILAVGATLAYFTDTKEATNTFTVGNIKIEQYETDREGNDFVQNQTLLPAVYTGYAWADQLITWNESTATEAQTKVFNSDMKNVIDKFVTVKNTGNSDAYVRTIIAIEQGYVNGLSVSGSDLIHVNINETDWTWSGWSTVEANGVKYDVNVATYTMNNGKLAAGQVTPPSFQQVFLNKNATQEQVAGFGADFDIIAVTEAVQAAGFSDATTALNEAFGEANTAYLAGVLAD